jgi:hypothetical protein
MKAIEKKIREDNITDFLTFPSTTDYVGHLMGPRSGTSRLFEIRSNNC